VFSYQYLERIAYCVRAISKKNFKDTKTTINATVAMFISLSGQLCYCTSGWLAVCFECFGTNWSGFVKQAL
jgi:hypothetical protein